MRCEGDLTHSETRDAEAYLIDKSRGGHVMRQLQVSFKAAADARSRPGSHVLQDFARDSRSCGCCTWAGAFIDWVEERDVTTLCAFLGR